MNRLSVTLDKTDLIDSDTLDWKCSAYFQDVNNTKRGIIGDHLIIVQPYRGSNRWKDDHMYAICGYMFSEKAVECSISERKKCGLCAVVINDRGVMWYTGGFICCECIKVIESVKINIERESDRLKLIFATQGDHMLMAKCTASKIVSSRYFTKKCTEMSLERCRKIITSYKEDEFAVNVCEYCLHTCKGRVCRKGCCDECLYLITRCFVDKYVFRYWVTVSLELLPELRDIVICMVMKT